MHPRRRIASQALVALLLLVAVAGCAPKRIFRSPETAPEPVPSSSSSPSSPSARNSNPTTAPDGTPAGPGAHVTDLVKQQIGTPYAFGGRAPEEGFDCSGLVQWAYQQVGVSLPRTVRDLAAVGQPVEAADLRAGDLVFFSIHSGGKPDHVGIYEGRHRFVHAPRQGNVVRSESLNDGWWRRRWTSSRRVN